ERKSRKEASSSSPTERKSRKEASSSSSTGRKSRKGTFSSSLTERKSQKGTFSSSPTERKSKTCHCYQNFSNYYVTFFNGVVAVDYQKYRSFGFTHGAYLLEHV